VADQAPARPGWACRPICGPDAAPAAPRTVQRDRSVSRIRTDSGCGRCRRRAARRPAFLRGSYDQMSPDGPEHFGAVCAKTVAMISAEPQIALTELTGIGAPTLVLQGDRDEVRLEHSAAVVAAIPRARLAVLPGTHALPIESSGVGNALLVDFLQGGRTTSTGRT